MAQPSAQKASFHPPDIAPGDLEAFHKAHFSTTSLDHFSTHFLGRVPEDEIQEGEEDYVEDDGLGYYPDGVKRTLTDEQIAMFRHSEIQALLRERRHAEENKASPARDDDPAAEAEDGEVEENEDMPAAPEPERRQQAFKAEAQNACAGRAARPRGEQGKGKKGGHKQPPKPDLRKRTWDKVGRGLQSLEYGEEEEARAAALPAAAQRRRVSYADV